MVDITGNLLFEDFSSSSFEDVPVPKSFISVATSDLSSSTITGFIGTIYSSTVYQYSTCTKYGPLAPENGL